VFVTAVTQLGLALARDVSLRGYLHFGLLFVPVWWAWVGYTNYADRFDSDDLLFRLLMLGGMFGITIVAVGSRTRSDTARPCSPAPTPRFGFC
jgi:low temperature requirement protein LtrA